MECFADSWRASTHLRISSCKNCAGTGCLEVALLMTSMLEPASYAADQAYVL